MVRLLDSSWLHLPNVERVGVTLQLRRDRPHARSALGALALRVQGRTCGFVSRRRIVPVLAGLAGVVASLSCGDNAAGPGSRVQLLLAPQLPNIPRRSKSLGIDNFRVIIGTPRTSSRTRRMRSGR